EIEQQIRKDAEIDFDITRVNWFSTYKVHTRHVSRFSAGRCFLAGDSAHIHTPAGAQGMNTGIQDGYNLAWKIASVLKGHTDGRILDTYNEERLPNAEALMKTTDRFFNLVASPHWLMAFIRIYVFPYVAQFLFSLDAVKRFVFPRISQIAINYRESSLSSSEVRFKVKAGDRMPWLRINGASVYDHLRKPGWHLVAFADDIDNAPSLPADVITSRLGPIDSHVFAIDDVITNTFASSSAFFLLIRPDNYIGLISNEFTPSGIEDYLERL
ncbi:MAG: FAD-dependent monooxygenase, partial [Pyrinomonadaceae bacterium]|nr:FAD-dependent monooxygenase [Pyrinomonadaceae bacterium]